jgi:hypothetical protein
MTAADLDSAIAVLASARTADEVFGVDARHTYRELAKLVHPDRVPAARAAEAAVAFARLVALWEGRHGATVTVTSRRASYRVGPVAATDEIADHHLATTSGGDDVIFKIARRPVHNDLMRAEAAALRHLARAVEERHRPFFPTIRESFRYDGEPGGTRTVNVLAMPDGLVSLADVRAAAPAGIDPRDAAWMWRRLLVALGAAHRAGLVHGAVFPEHVLIEPDQHGVVLAGWCYAADGPDARIAGMIARYQDWYPPEVAARQPARAATDIHLATATMVALIGERLPAELARFARGCTLRAPAGRPDDAWQLLAELDELLERLYGRRRFRPFTFRR